MKNTLYVKIIFLYLVFGLVSFLSIASLGSYLAQRHVVKETAEKLYKEANYIASNYAVQYAQNQITLRDVQAQLDAIDIYLDVYKRQSPSRPWPKSPSPGNDCWRPPVRSFWKTATHSPTAAIPPSPE